MDEYKMNKKLQNLKYQLRIQKSKLFHLSENKKKSQKRVILNTEIAIEKLENYLRSI